MVSNSSSDTSIPLGYVRRSKSASTRSPSRVFVLPIRLTTTAWLTNGCPRQFSVIRQNNWCSILFHLLVPGGKWHTLSFRPVSSANVCKQNFHSRQRTPLLPPASTVISNSSAPGYL